MWFMIKGAFWFSLVLMALPFLSQQSENDASETTAQLDVGDSLSAALTALADIRRICERQPEVCETGGQTFAALGARARDGALIAYEFLDSRFSDTDAPTDTAAGNAEVLTGPADPELATGSLPANKAENIGLSVSGS